MSSTVIIFTLFLLWTINASRRMLYSIYFWQLKEYRFDRIKGDLKRSLKVLFPKTAIISIIILILWFFIPDKNLWNKLVLITFYIFGAYSVFLFWKKATRIPKFTKKVILLVFISSIISISCLVVFSSKLFLFIVIFEIILSAITLLATIILQIPTVFIKKGIYKKAKRKIKGLKSLTVIGITGSYGKSSTKEFLYTILSKKYNVLKTTGNINTEIGVAQTIINKLNSAHEIFIVEMGAYRKGEIKLLCDIAQPKIGIVTGVNEQHLALFGSFKNLLSAEGGKELAESLPDDGMLVVNGDNKYCLKLYKTTNKKKKIYSLNNKKIDSDIWSEEITIDKDHISFLATDKSGELSNFYVKILGRQSVQNILGAILIAKEFGMSFEEISEACKEIQPEDAGLVLRKTKYKIDVVDSSYSANPDGVFADLDYFSAYPNKKAIVMPCLIELGEKSSEIHEKIGREIGKICNLAIITTKDNFKDIKRGFNKTKKDSKSQCILCDNSQDIFSKITTYCKEGDAVLLEGRVPLRLIELLK